MALAKMVGFEVIPRTPSDTNSASWPFSSQSRGSLSTRGLSPPISYSSWRRVISEAPSRCAQESLCPLDNMFNRETKLFHGDGAGRRCPEGVEAERCVGIAVPAERGGRLHAQSGDVGREDLGPIDLVLILEP